MPAPAARAEAPKAEAKKAEAPKSEAKTEPRKAETHPATASTAEAARAKVEKLGLKTYTQVASTPGGNRIRVRVGPFGSRDEAAKALAKAKGAGISAVVLTL